MNRSLKWFLVITMLFASPTLGQVFTDQADFDAACTGLVTEGFESIEFEDGDNVVTVQGDQVFDNFTLSAFANVPENDANIPAGLNQLSLGFSMPDPADPIFVTSLEGANILANEYCLEFSQDTNSFAFEYSIIAVLGGTGTGTIELIDPDGNIIIADNLQATSDTLLDDFWGYTGTDTIAQVKIRTDTTVLDGIQFGLAFQNVTSGICVPPPAESCFDQIAFIKSDLALLLPDAQGHELYKLQNAFDCLCIMEDPIFWQDDFSRLSPYGSNFFIGGAYTIAWLEASGNSDVEPIIASILETLECIVDNEIDFAIANGGHACFLAYAEAYADVADTLYEDLDLPVVSALAYRLAWLHAFYSTY